MAGKETFSGKTGIELSPAKWKEGWDHASAKRKAEREDRMRAKAGQYVGSARAFLASPKTAFEEYAGVGGAGRFLKKRFGGAYKKKAAEAEQTGQRADDMDATVKEMDEELAGVASYGDKGTVMNAWRDAYEERETLEGAEIPKEDDASGGKHVQFERTTRTQQWVQGMAKEYREQATTLREGGHTEHANDMDKLADELETQLVDPTKDFDIDLNAHHVVEFDEKEGKLKRKTLEDDFSKRLVGRRAEARQVEGDGWETMRNVEGIDPLAYQQLVIARNTTKKAADSYREQAQEQQDKAKEYRLPVDYERRVEERSRRKEEMGKMTGDDWHEQLDVVDDAIQRGDFNRASAALMRATEYANENEILNSYGFDSSSQGLKEFIMSYFVGTKGGFSKEMAQEMRIGWDKVSKVAKKGMGMSVDQALTLANDLSYSAEKKNHWEVARAVTTKNGQMSWADPDERYTEQLAEIRKLDFEYFNRNANRLAHFIEEPDGDNVEDRARRFRATGDRQARVSPFGLTWFTENFEKYESLIPRGRFNPSVSVNITTPESMSQVQQFIEQYMPEKLDNWQRKMLPALKDYVGQVSATPGREFQGMERSLRILKNSRTGKF